jgi:hypothetical protein
MHARPLLERTAFYTVQIQPSALKQAHALPLDAFQRLQRELGAIAELAGYAPSVVQELGPRVPMSLTMPDYEVRYIMDADAQTLSVVEIVRAPPA